jgi:uncharacterized protein (TIGR00369 family)
MSENIQYVRNIVKGKVDLPNIAKLLGFNIIDYCEGCTKVEIDIDKRLFNPKNTVHGGVYCDIADAAMGLSFLTILKNNETFTSIDLRITFLRTVREGKLTASSKIVKRGKRLGYMECEIWNEKKKLVAKASSTCMVLKKE